MLWQVATNELSEFNGKNTTYDSYNTYSIEHTTLSDIYRVSAHYVNSKCDKKVDHKPATAGPAHFPVPKSTAS